MRHHARRRHSLQRRQDQRETRSSDRPPEYRYEAEFCRRLRIERYEFCPNPRPPPSRMRSRPRSRARPRPSTSTSSGSTGCCRSTVLAGSKCSNPPPDFPTTLRAARTLLRLRPRSCRGRQGLALPGDDQDRLYHTLRSRAQGSDREAIGSLCRRETEARPTGRGANPIDVTEFTSVRPFPALPLIIFPVLQRPDCATFLAGSFQPRIT